MSTNNNSINLLSVLRNNNCIESKTIDSLIGYGFDSNQTLFALDFNRDLPQMTNISIKQQIILKQVLNKYRNSVLDLNKSDNCLTQESDEESIEESESEDEFDQKLRNFYKNEFKNRIIIENDLKNEKQLLENKLKLIENSFKALLNSNINEIISLKNFMSDNNTKKIEPKVDLKEIKIEEKLNLSQKSNEDIDKKIKKVNKKSVIIELDNDSGDEDMSELIEGKFEFEDKSNLFETKKTDKWLQNETQMFESGSQDSDQSSDINCKSSDNNNGLNDNLEETELQLRNHLKISNNEKNILLSCKGLASKSKVKDFYECLLINGKKWFVCKWNECLFKTKSSQKIAHHINLSHIGIEFKCFKPNCNKVFKNPNTYREHLKNHICGFGLFGYGSKQVVGVCRNNSLNRWRERVTIDSKKLFRCKWKNCSTVTPYHMVMKRHIHNHLCPYRANLKLKHNQFIINDIKSETWNLGSHFKSKPLNSGQKRKRKKSVPDNQV